MTNTNTLGITIKEILSDYWETNKKALLLSNLSPLLIDKIPDYKQTLAGKSLKDFIRESSHEFEYKLVEHPAQSAKIGVIPEGVDFSFLNEKSIQQEKLETNYEKSIFYFLKELKKLDPEDIDKIQIPLSVLVKLIK